MSGSPLCVSGTAPSWQGASGNASATVGFFGVFGSIDTEGGGSLGVGNDVVQISDPACSGPNKLVWAGCLNTLTGNYGYIPGAAYGTNINAGVSTVNVSAGACPACQTTSCPSPPNTALAYSGGSLAGPKTAVSSPPLTSPHGANYWYIQSTISWSGGTGSLTGYGSGCEGGPVSLAVSVASAYYAMDGATVVDTDTFSESTGILNLLVAMTATLNPGYWVLAFSVPDVTDPSQVALGDPDISGRIPIGFLCHLNDPRGTYPPVAGVSGNSVVS